MAVGKVAEGRWTRLTWILVQGLALMSMVSLGTAGMEVVYLVRENGDANLAVRMGGDDLVEGLLNGALFMGLIAQMVGVVHIRPVFIGKAYKVDS